MQGNELLADPTAPAVDTEGTVWVFEPESDGWRYVTNEGRLSWDIHHTPPDTYAPYVALDRGAARLIISAIST